MRLQGIVCLLLTLVHIDEKFNCLKKRFPNVTALMAKHEPTAYTFQMEEFANLTTCAFNNGDIEEAREHLLFMSEKFNTANRVEREYIDTYYVEHLFWQATDSAIRTG